ncbi:hypothetical protein, partial [Bacillus pumilus]
EKRIEEQRLSSDLKQLEHELRHVLEQVEVADQEKTGFNEENKELEEARANAVKKLAELEEEEKATHQAIQAAEFARKASES